MHSRSLVVLALCAAFGAATTAIATPAELSIDEDATSIEEAQGFEDVPSAVDDAPPSEDAQLELVPALEHDPVVEARPELEIAPLPPLDDSVEERPQHAPPVAARALPDNEPEFEQEPQYRADQLVEPALLSGPTWQLDPIVPVRGYLAQFRLATDYGYLQVQGRAELAERIFEIEVVEQLAALSRSRAFLDAVEHSGKDIGETLKRIGTRPIATLKAIPSGLMRSLRSKWRALKEETRKARDAAEEELTEDDSRPGVGPQAPDARKRERDWWERSAQTSGKLAKRWLGFNKARRALAFRLGVDPYSRNALLNRELDRVAWANLIGNKTLNAAIDAITPGAREALGWSRKIDSVVWDLDPVALAQLQRERLHAQCGAEPMIDKAMHQGALSPSQWQRLVDALHALRVEHCGALMTLVATTETDAEARYVVRALELLEAHRDAGARIDLIFVGQTLVARIDMRRLVVPLPLDVLSWTEPVAALFDENGLRSAQRELWLDGEATLRAQREQTARGFGLRVDLPRSTRTSLPAEPGDGER